MEGYPYESRVGGLPRDELSNLYSRQGNDLVIVSTGHIFNKEGVRGRGVWQGMMAWKGLG